MTQTITPSSPDIYVPPKSRRLSDPSDSQVRAGIQGPPFSGKTTAALTFPNPIILSFDRKTQAHKHRSDVIEMPFYDPEFCDEVWPRDIGMNKPPNRKDALLKWLSTEGLKLTKNQTLIPDGNTGIEEAYHTWFDCNKQLAVTAQGQKNEFIEWRLKNEFYADLHTAMKALKCNVVYICHETPDRDKKGELNGKIRPLLSGQSGDKLAGNMTDFFRAIVITKPNNDAEFKKVMEWARVDKATVEEWIASTPTVHQSIYLWQTQEDELFDGGTSSLRDCPKYVLAHYNSFLKYGKQLTTAK